MSLYPYARDMVRALYDARIHTPAILDPLIYFPGAPAFTTRWRDIRNEALAIARDLAHVPRFHDIMSEQADISANDGRDWRMFILRAYGIDVPDNQRRCPMLAALLRGNSAVASCVLSFLAPGKHVPVHRGPFRGILRFHLILSMPLDAQGHPAAVLEIDGEPHRLCDGDSLLWDDTYPHEVWNRSNEVRIALLLDVWRPAMPLDMTLLSRAVSAVVRAGIRRNGMSYSG